MPIVEHIKKDTNYEIVVWDVIEDNAQLLENLSLNASQLAKYEGLSEKRKREFLGIMSCMKVLGVEEEILYDENGKPYVEDNVYLSFSHSYGKVAVAISPFPIGVDIELTRNEKIRNIESKFVREDEAEFLPKGQEKDAYLHIIWGLKEGLYKLNGGNLWNFLHHYKVEPFGLQENSVIFCWVIDEKNANKYAGFYRKVEQYYLVWVIDILDI